MTPENREKLLDAALGNVPFDGWSDACLAAAAGECRVDLADAKAAFPKGGLDLAIAFHLRGDKAMSAALKAAKLSEMRIREKITFAVRTRIEIAGEHKEAVRRGTSLFALPQNSADGAKLIWGTADAIWDGIGDRSADYNWYTKRATLSGVYSSTVLFWLGDGSEGHGDTWEFLDRRIENVMQFEKFKAQMRDNKTLKPITSFAEGMLSKIRPPMKMPDRNLPGHMFRGDK